MNPTKALLRASLVGASMAVPLLVWAQGQAYCQINQVEVQRLSNGVQVIIRADGAMYVDLSPSRFFNLEALYTGRGDWRKPTRVLEFFISNGRTQIGNFVEIGVYPVSHIEMSVPPEAPEGIGIQLRVVLYTEGTPWRLVRERGSEFTRPLSQTPAPAISIQMSPDQTSLILVVTSDRRIPPPFVRPTPPENASRHLQVVYEGGRVSLYALNADLQAVIQQIREATGEAVFVSEGLNRTVSASLADMSLYEMLNALAVAYGLTLTQQDSAYWLSEGDLRDVPTYEQTAMQVVPVRHISALTVRNCLPDSLLRYVRVDAEQNALVVAGPEWFIQKVKHDIARLDRPPIQLEVELSLYEVGDTRSARQAWRVLLSKDSEAYGFDMEEGTLGYFFLQEEPPPTEIAIQSLLQQVKARFVSQSLQRVLLGQPATLFLGQQRTLKTLRFDPYLYGFVEDVVPVDIGITIRAEPLCAGHDSATLRLTTEFSNVVELEVGTGLPTLSTRFLRSVLRVPYHQTVLVGGFSTEQVDSRRRAIPLLGQLPIVGWLFTNRQRVRTTTEFLALVRVRPVENRSGGSER